MRFLAILLLAVMLLTSCANTESSEAPSTAGVGRTTAVSADVPEESTSDTSAETEDPATGGSASYDGSELGGNLSYTTYKGKKITDFSFLDGLSKNFFSFFYIQLVFMDTDQKVKGNNQVIGFKWLIYF